jgi:hypothetical protein
MSLTDAHLKGISPPDLSQCVNSETTSELAYLNWNVMTPLRGLLDPAMFGASWS